MAKSDALPQQPPLRRAVAAAITPGTGSMDEPPTRSIDPASVRSAAEAAEAMPAPAPSSVPFLAPATRVAHHEIIRPIGRGGMGQVYLARDTRLGRLVALKFLTDTSAQQTERFQIEARATAQLAHENIVSLHDIGEHQGALYMVLEYVKGKTLKEWLDARAPQGDEVPSGGAALDQLALPARRVVELMLPVVRALVVAHEAGIVHRDLKPANIMLSDSGTVKVLDFGIAKLLGATGTTSARAPSPGEAVAVPGADTHMTAAGARIGTYAYMSPEQWAGADVDHRTDLWAVGIMMYRLAVGRHPLGAMSMGALETLTDASIPMPSVREARPGLGKLGAVIDRCLIKRKEDRIATARTLLAELESIVLPELHIDGEASNPYAGLASFQEQDANRFFGRDRAIAQVVARLAEQPLIAIVGPSGAGKSSFVRAGVIPALKRGGDAWEAFIVRPGTRPLVALAHLLSQHSWTHSTHTQDPASAELFPSHQERDQLRDRLLLEPGLFGTDLRARARRRLERVVLFIDQFEELYTLAPVEERQAFLACLAGAADDASSPLRVVLSMRSDFLDRMADAPPSILELVSRNTVLVRPMDREGLRSALIKPAEVAAYAFESTKLVEEILDALEHTSGALPILQFTAAKLWEMRDRQRHVLTEESYRSLGGVAGALASHADAVLGSMGTSERKWARALLLRLVTPERTRAISTLGELRELGGGAAAEIERVLARLIDARLLTVEGSSQDESTVEIIHESLIDRWPLLSRWLEEEQKDAQFLARLRGAAKDWEAGGRADGLLWRGEPGEEGQRWYERYLASGTGTLGRREEQYLRGVIALAARSRRSRRYLLGGTFALLAAGITITSYLAWQQSRAKHAALQAIFEARDAGRLSAARLEPDPTTQIALLRELEGTAPPAGWAAEAKRLLHAGVARVVYAEHADAIYGLSFSPDGRRIATGSLDKTVRVWNSDGAGPTLVLDGHTLAVNQVAFSPRGDRVASGSDDKTIRVWNADGSGQPLVLAGHTASVWNLAYSPDGRRIASASVDRTVRIWSADGSGEPVVLAGHGDTVASVAFSPDGRRIASSSKDRTLRIWNTDGSGQPLIVTGHGAGVRGVAFAPDGRRLATASGDKTVRVWAADGSELLVLRGHTDSVNDLTFSPDGRRIVSVSDDRTVRVWNSDGSGEPIVLTGHGSDMQRAVFSPTGDRIASASNDGTVRVWDARDSGATIVLGGKDVSDVSPWSVAFSPDGKRVLTGSRGNTIRVWNADGSGEPLALTGAAEGSYCAAFSPDGRRIVMGSNDKVVRVRNADGSGEPILLRGHAEAIWGVAFSPDGRRVASASADKTVRVWNADGSGQPQILQAPASLIFLAYSPDGRHVAAGDREFTLWIWNTDRPQEPRALRGHTGSLNGVAFSPDGRRIASASGDNTIRVWNVDGSGQPLVLRGHSACANGVMFSPDGQRLVSGSDDGTLRIWSADGAGQAIVLTGHAGAVHDVAFSPDGRRAASTSSDRTVRIWNDLDPVTIDDPVLWRATNYCLSVARRQQLLSVSEPVARTLHERCLARVAGPRDSVPR